MTHRGLRKDTDNWPKHTETECTHTEMRHNDTQRAVQTHGQLAETHKDGVHTHKNAAQGHQNGRQRPGAKTENDVQRERATEHKPQTPRKHREWTTMLRHRANTENAHRHDAATALERKRNQKFECPGVTPPPTIVGRAIQAPEPTWLGETRANPPPLIRPSDSRHPPTNAY